VRLHADLVAEAYACPACGAQLAIEVRWNADEPLHDIELAHAATPNGAAPLHQAGAP
jgi:hypothetical protein